jgi:metal transporter CNNM
MHAWVLRGCNSLGRATLLLSAWNCNPRVDAVTSGVSVRLEHGLQIVAESGAPSKKRDALRIQPLRKRGNLLLCTLLLGNVAVNSALSILMSEVTGSGGGFVASTAIIVVFGEILPQATCSRFPLCETPTMS